MDCGFRGRLSSGRQYWDLCVSTFFLFSSFYSSRRKWLASTPWFDSSPLAVFSPSDQVLQSWDLHLRNGLCVSRGAAVTFKRTFSVIRESYYWAKQSIVNLLSLIYSFIYTTDDPNFPDSINRQTLFNARTWLPDVSLTSSPSFVSIVDRLPSGTS